MILSRVLCSDVAGVAGTAPPTEFRIFKVGENPTTKGVFLFDAAAAQAVMAAYQAQGVDYMIDLEHQALGDPNRADSADARGWFKLELRNGELWAVDCKWTPDGARRLAEKTQRYTSPAFLADESGRVVELINVALVAMPATHGAAPLVAAAKRACASTGLPYTGGSRPHGQRLNRMDPKQVQAALDALEAGDQAKGLEILKAMIAAAASGGATPEPAASGDALSDTAADDPADPAKPDPKMAARLAKLETEAAERNKAMAERLSKLEAEAVEADRTERVALVGSLVKLGVETPATAWEGDPEQLKPRARFMSEPIAELRERVAVLTKRGPIVTHAPPTGDKPEIKLSKEQAAYCTKHGLTPEQFQARKAASANLHKASK